jgi:hypothetical protein
VDFAIKQQLNTKTLLYIVYLSIIMNMINIEKEIRVRIVFDFPLLVLRGVN